MGETQWPLPVVGETFDGWLNDIAGQHVTEAHVLHALDNATTGPVPEGNVGGGTGMISYEFKGGTGTASRIIETRAGISPWGCWCRPIMGCGRGWRSAVFASAIRSLRTGCSIPSAARSS